MKKPAWQITLAGQLVDVNKRLASLVLVDNRGIETDTLTLTLSDKDGLLRIPPRGRELEVAIGYTNSPLIYRGKYNVNRVRHTSTPDQLVIEAKSADFNSRTLQSGQKQSWSIDETGGKLGNIVKTIATRNNLTARITAKLDALQIGHVDQTESDAHFLTRLAEENDALATIKAGKLLFIPLGVGKTADGESIAPIQLQRNQCDTHNYSLVDAERYTGVRAFYHLNNSATRQHVDVGKDGYRRHLSGSKASKERAYAAAQAEWKRLQRDTATIELSVTDAPPDIFAETPLQLAGWRKPEIDGNNWIITKALLDINESGLTARINAETRLA